MRPKLVIALFGPTASGKSAVAEELAQRLETEVVSADAMQVYRSLPILTNQPEVPTRLVGIWPLDTEGSVGRYAPLAHAAIDEVLEAGGAAIVAGGTGLYLRAALAELDVPPAPLPGTRARLERLYDDLGPDRCHALLAERDPAAAQRVHPHDRRRVIRGLELASSGRSLRPDHDQLWEKATRHPTVIIGLDASKDTLERRIDARTRAMFDRGVEEEVERAMMGRLSATARRVIGLSEIAELPRERAIEAIAIRTRRYAAYQRKWMRRVPGITILDAERDLVEIAEQAMRVVRGETDET